MSIQRDGSNIENSEQVILNNSYDKKYNVLASELVAESGSSLVRVAAEDVGGGVYALKTTASISGGGGGGTEYADGTLRGTATGTLAMGDDGTNIQSIKTDSSGVLAIQDNGGSITVDGSVNAVQSGTWNVNTFPQVYNGSAFTVIPGDFTNGMDVDVTRSVLPTGAATETTLSALNTKTPSLGAAAASASSPVTLPNDLSVSGGSLSAPVINTELLTNTVGGWYDAANFHSVCIQIQTGAGISAGVITFEQTNDTTVSPNGNVYSVQDATAINANPVTTLTLAASSTRIYTAPVTARYIRVRVSTAVVGGTVQATAVFSQLPYANNTINVQQATAASLAVDTELAAAAAMADGQANPTAGIAAAFGSSFNGTTWDRNRNNVIATVDASAARTASGTGVTATNFNARGAFIFINVTAVSGTTPTMTVRVQAAYDGTNFVDMDTTNLQTASITGVSTAVLRVYPGIATAANSSLNMMLPRTWRLAWTIGGTTPSFTFTTTVNYIL